MVVDPLEDKPKFVVRNPFDARREGVEGPQLTSNPEHLYGVYIAETQCFALWIKELVAACFPLPIGEKGAGFCFVFHGGGF